jgi:hypothetical protein
MRQANARTCGYDSIIMSKNPSDDAPAEIPYQSIPESKMVRIAQYSAEYEAELNAAALNNEGIRTQLFGANVSAMNWLWSGFNKIDLLVPQEDVERATQILARTSTDELEPVPMPDGAPPPVDDQGNVLAVVGSYGSYREMSDAQTVLASARIRAFIPSMAPRGDRPPGVGNRFVLWVAKDDLNRAKSLLADEAQDDTGEPRCPKCGSWRVLQPESLIGGLAALVGLGHERQFECLSCHYRAAPAEFLKRWRTD